MRLDRTWRAAACAGLAALSAGCVTSTGEPVFPGLLRPPVAAPAAELAPLSIWESADPAGWAFVAQSPAALALAEVEVRFTHRIDDDVRLDETFALALTPLQSGADGGEQTVALARLAGEDLGRARLVQSYLSTRALEAGRSGYTVVLGFAPDRSADALTALCNGAGALYSWMRFEDAAEMTPIEPDLDGVLGLSDQFESARAQVCASAEPAAAADEEAAADS